MQWRSLWWKIKKILKLKIDGPFFNSAFNIIFKRRKLVEHLYFEVIGACQYNCTSCSHEELRFQFRSFQLSIEEIKNFLHFTEKSNYHIHRLEIHGPGEPLLWKGFNDGVKMLKESGRISKIIVITNGLLLKNIKDETWKYIFQLRISLYPMSDILGSIKEKQKKFGRKIKVNKIDQFDRVPEERHENTTPCQCACPGPMFLKDRIILFCGPPGIHAAKLAGVDIINDPEMSEALGVNYLSRLDQNKIGKLKICEYCWANCNIKKEDIPVVSVKPNRVAAANSEVKQVAS